MNAWWPGDYGNDVPRETMQKERKTELKLSTATENELTKTVFPPEESKVQRLDSVHLMAVSEVVQ